MTTCYILAWISPELLFTDVGLCGEGADDVTIVDTKDTPITLLQDDGRNYEEARRNVLNRLAARVEREGGIWPKIKAMVDEDERRNQIALERVGRR